MPTIKITFPTPTDNVTSSSNLDILLYNGLSGSQNLFATILKNDVRKSIVGANIEITGIVVDASTTYNFSAKAVDEAGNLSANFSPVTVHIVPADAPAPSVMFTTANTTISAGTAFVAGTPNKFESSATAQFLKHNTLKSGAFSMRMFITDIFTKSIGFGLDDADNNTDPVANWNVYVQVAESYAIKIGGALVDPTVPTTITAGAGRYVRLSRTASGSSILLHYFDGTSEILVHTFAAASGATVLKANIVSANRKIYDIQTT
jgi:hypothetical protein